MRRAGSPAIITYYEVVKLGAQSFLGGNRPRQVKQIVSNSLIPDDAIADFGKSEGGVQRMGSWVWGIEVHFADNPLAPRSERMFKKIVIKAPRVAASAGCGRDNDAIDVDEARIASAEP